MYSKIMFLALGKIKKKLCLWRCFDIFIWVFCVIKKTMRAVLVFSCFISVPILLIFYFVLILFIVSLLLNPFLFFIGVSESILFILIFDFDHFLFCLSFICLLFSLSILICVYYVFQFDPSTFDFLLFLLVFFAKFL